MHTFLQTFYKDSWHGSAGFWWTFFRSMIDLWEGFCLSRLVSISSKMSVDVDQQLRKKKKTWKPFLKITMMTIAGSCSSSLTWLEYIMEPVNEKFEYALHNLSLGSWPAIKSCGILIYALSLLLPKMWLKLKENCFQNVDEIQTYAGHIRCPSERLPWCFGSIKEIQ